MPQEACLSLWHRGEWSERATVGLSVSTMACAGMDLPRLDCPPKPWLKTDIRKPSGPAEGIFWSFTTLTSLLLVYQLTDSAGVPLQNSETLSSFFAAVWGAKHALRVSHEGNTFITRSSAGLPSTLHSCDLLEKNSDEARGASC